MASVVYSSILGGIFTCSKEYINIHILFSLICVTRYSILPFCMSIKSYRVFGHSIQLEEYIVFQISFERFLVFLMAINYLKKKACVKHRPLRIAFGDFILFMLVIVWHKI